MPTKEVDNGKLLQKFRRLVTVYLGSHQIETAVFWSSQAASLSDWCPDDVLRHAECLLLAKQYHRVAHLLKSRQLDTTTLKGNYLAAKAVYESGDDHNDALLILESGVSLVEKAMHNLEKGRPMTGKFGAVSAMGIDGDSPVENTRRILGSIYLLRGRILEALDNRPLASEAFKEALRMDSFCMEAFKALVNHEILTAEEEKELLVAMPIEDQCDSSEEKEIVTFLITMMTKKYDKPSKMTVPPLVNGFLQTSTEFRIAKAERFFYNCDFKSCFKETSSIISQNPDHGDCLPIHLSCMVELGKSYDLFLLAHKLVDLYPKWMVAWFAVGCYYFAVGKHEFARTHFCKATQLDRVFGPAWLAYGHSFALENEHDQAMAAYFKACQLMKGCHLPLLYVGVENGLTNNIKLAERFFSQALEIAPKDPFVLHEMGVACFQNQEYSMAEKYFFAALRQVKIVSDSSGTPDKWEPLFNNLGHTCRKLGRFEEALNFHRQALVLKPEMASTYSAIGYVQTLQGNLSEAVEAFHKALGIRRDDTFSTTMLNQVIEQLMTDDRPFQDFPNEIPKMDLTAKKLSHARSRIHHDDDDDEEEEEDEEHHQDAVDSSGVSGIDVEMADI